MPKFSVNHGTGFTGFGAVGYGFGNGLRVEAEGLYNFSHDEYTDQTSLQNYFHETGSSFYTAVPGAKQVPCTGSGGFWAPGSSSVGHWGVGNPKTNGTEANGNTTTTPSDKWDWIPADKCYIISNQTTYNAFNNSHAIQDNAPFGYIPEGYTHGINPDPGTYYYEGNVNSGGFSGGSGTGKGDYSLALSGANVLTPIPFPINHRSTDESYGGFFNVLYDFDLERLFGVKSIVTPFIGGGAGYLWQRYNRPSSNTIIPYIGGIANPMIGAITGTHGGFSWQGIAGVAFDTGISGLQVVAQYRMIGQPGSFYNGAFNYGTEDGHANFDQRFNHQFIVGFRYAFQNQPIHHIQPPAVRPIVAAAPAPVPARSYLVFFDWNQYALTSRARQIVVEAAHATSYVHTTRINVNGYTDSSAAPGPAGQKYNYALSVKRARSVEAELIRNGVPASEIVIRGYGDTNPLVPTAPNTREPQNRRVEIILHA